MATINFGASGYVVARRLDRHGDEIQRLEFHNDVLESGMDSLVGWALGGFGGAPGYSNAFIDRFAYLFLGTGTTEPTPSDTGLQSRSGTLAGKACLGIGGSPTTRTRRAHADTTNHVYWTEADYVFKYGEGEAEGVWTELGLANATDYSVPFTRALFRDDTGAATSLTILADEFLEVTYTLRFYSGIGRPVPGSVTVNGVSNGYYLRAVAGGSSNGWLSNGTSTSYDAGFEDTGLWAFYFPFCNMRALRTYDGLDYFRVGLVRAHTTYTRTYDPLTRTITHALTFDPTSTDTTIAAFLACSLHSGYQDGGYQKGLYVIHLDSPFTKKADYRVTFEIQATVNYQLNQIEGVALAASTATSLDFSWDAYTNATEYTLILRQGATVIQTQTVTAPTTTASFTGLTASTDYTLDIQAVTTNYDSVRAIVPASTTA